MWLRIATEAKFCEDGDDPYTSTGSEAKRSAFFQKRTVLHEIT
jgi:hypothetical protein